MKKQFAIQLEDTNQEVVARIARSVSHKFDCTIEIDFRNGNRRLKFIGDKSLVPHIAEEVRDIFR